jgi:3-isopropylmalate/(R)-2-methylmalate dehydratase small subunit
VSTLVKRGRAHVLGDAIPLDEGFIPFEMAIQRVTDPQKLIPRLFEKVAPGFAARARPGDLVIAGSQFGFGKPHVQGFIALQALGTGVVCVSMPFKNLRRAVAKGLPVIVGAPPAADVASDGDELEIDFATGLCINHTRNTRLALPPMPPILLDIVRQGGMDGLMKSWLQAHPEQRATDEDKAVLDTVDSAAVSIVKKNA